MGTFTGLFDLKTPRDLLEKLRRDFRRIAESPTDQCAAFDFFVTAEHMVDWLYPGDGNCTKREQERGRNVLLQVCSHIASGSKHFQATAKHHTSVKDATVEQRGAWPGTF